MTCTKKKIQSTKLCRSNLREGQRKPVFRFLDENLSQTGEMSWNIQGTTQNILHIFGAPTPFFQSVSRGAFLCVIGARHRRSRPCVGCQRKLFNSLGARAVSPGRHPRGVRAHEGVLDGVQVGIAVLFRGGTRHPKTTSGGAVGKGRVGYGETGRRGFVQGMATRPGIVCIQQRSPWN